jgi:hypothetical protein
MKLFHYIFALGSAALLFSACESNLDKVVYNSNTAKPAVLQTLKQSSYVLNQDNTQDSAFTVTWDKPDVGYQAEVTSVLQMDLDGKDFANAIALSSTKTDSSYTLTVGELNNKILSMLDNYNMDLSPVKLAFRVISTISNASDTLVSNVVNTTVTPYSAEKDYPKIYIIGDYCGWNWDNTQHLFSFNSDATYQGIIDFGTKAANGFKISGQAAWVDAVNWGIDSKATAPTSEASSIQLIASGGSGNIQAYSKRFYRFTYNTSSLVLTKDLSFTTLSIVGDAGSEVSGWGTKEVDMNFDPKTQQFYADVDLSDGEIKFRLDHAWDTAFGSKTDGLLDSSGNIKVTAGKYRIYVNINNPNNMTYKLSTKDYGK